MRKWFPVFISISLLATGFFLGSYVNTALAASVTPPKSNNATLVSLLGTATVTVLLIVLELLKKSGRLSNPADEKIDAIHLSWTAHDLERKLSDIHNLLHNPLEEERRKENRRNLNTIAQVIPTINAIHEFLKSPNQDTLPPLTVLRHQVQQVHAMVDELSGVTKQWLTAGGKNEQVLVHLLENALERLRSLESVYGQILTFMENKNGQPGKR